MRTTKVAVTSLIGLMLIIMLALPGLTCASQVRTVDGSGYGIYQAGEGGEFTFQILTGDLLGMLANYSDKTKNVSATGSTFETFCLEHNEYIYPYTTFDATISYGAVAGGVSGGGVDGIDPISKGTALLYYEFATGILDYSYSDGIAARKSSAAELQQAIWYLEDEISLTSDQINNNDFLQMVNTEFGNLTEAKKAANGAYGVAVLNITVVGTDTLRQSQLALVPEPGSLILLGISLLGIAGAVRKSRGQ